MYLVVKCSLLVLFALAVQAEETEECTPCAGHERAFIMLKPDALHRELCGEVINRLERKGLHLIGMKLVRASEELAKVHYKDHENKTIFPSLIKYITSGPVVAMVWEGYDVIYQVRLMMGGHPQRVSSPHLGYLGASMKYALPGTIRGDLVQRVDKNLIHASDTIAAAEREISLWFEPQELVCWKASNCDWM
ncbi:nucleoside diphosphate kinase A-like isoform X3 [Dinothrombium tinctorium]|uniref:Nucleoside diphosphate kinase n=1 Tax=Dinothrombium tinctorium TaxID=1965070 RepID=A0A443R1C7_9ACAR|nr:nucleoside diphosphate kinase A-like isoform X3 [Dinothrombium tinctorium]